MDSSIATIVSVVALLVSVYSLYYTKKQVNWQIEQHYRDCLHEYILVSGEFQRKYELMRRMRDKTGIPIADHEDEVFLKYEETIKQSNELCVLLNNLIRDGQFGDNGRIRDTCMSGIVMIKLQNQKLDELVERFGKVSDNNIKQIQEFITDLHKRLA